MKRLSAVSNAVVGDTETTCHQIILSQKSPLT